MKSEDQGTFYEQDFSWQIRGQFFSEDRMFSRLKMSALHKGQEQTYRALLYARDAHAGQLRRKHKFSDLRQDYFTHPLLIVCHMEGLGIDEDEMLAAGLLHDVCEDCGIHPDDLPFPGAVRHSVDLLTKRKDALRSKEDQNRTYYDRIRHDRIAAVVKIVDRCHNISTMAQAFSNAKLSDYINETETYVIPLIKDIKHTWPEYSDLAFLVKYHILAVIETAKVMMLQEQELEKDIAGLQNSTCLP